MFQTPIITIDLLRCTRLPPPVKFLAALAIMFKSLEKVLWRLGASPVAPRACAAPWPAVSDKRSKAPVTVILDKDGTVRDGICIFF